MDIDKITIGEAKKLMQMFGAIGGDDIGYDDVWEVGKTYLIRTVTMIDTGVLVSVGDKELVLEDAAWIADTGRFADAVRAAEFNEVEPFPDGKIIIGRGSIIDAVIINKSPRSQK